MGNNKKNIRKKRRKEKDCIEVRKNPPLRRHGQAWKGKQRSMERNLI